MTQLLQDSSDSDEKKKIDSIKAVYTIAIETRNFEINQLIQRNNFFMLFQGVLLASALQTQASKPIVEFIACCAGIWISIYQMQMAAGAKYWQEWWESRVDGFENELGKVNELSKHFLDLFNVERAYVSEAVSTRLDKSPGQPFTNMLILKSFRVGRVPINVGLVLVVIWCALLWHTVDFSNRDAPRIKGFTFVETPKT